MCSTFSLRSVIILGMFFCFLYLGSVWYFMMPWHHRVTIARARIYPTKGNSCEGAVTFTQEKDGVRVHAQCSGLPQGKHGFHIHEFGDCACDDAVCTGGHYNPTNMPHGGPTSAQRHVGDFGNIEADASGNAVYDFLDPQLSLNGPEGIIGRSVIIHAQEDDLVSQPTGNAGARIGCGVIGTVTTQ